MARRILFVCSGNQCRSPVAAKMFEMMLKREGVNGVEVMSAGTVTSGGEPATRETREIAAQIGIDLSDHNSIALDAEILRNCDLILVMEEVHRVSILGKCPDIVEKVKLLKSYSAHSRPDEGIPDPSGFPAVAYRTCFAGIMEALDGLIKAIKVDSGQQTADSGQLRVRTNLLAVHTIVNQENRMKIFAMNSSPRKQKSNTDLILQPFLEGAREAGAEVDMVYLHGMKIKTCLGCFHCWLKTPGVCVQKDDMAGLLDRMMQSDLRVFATPLYVFGMNAQMKLFLDRIMPIALPTIVLKDGHCTHPARVEQKKPAGLVVISNCGFHELDNFDEMMAHFKALCKHGRMKLVGALLRPEGEFMAFADKFMPDKHKAVIEAAREAGRQAVKKGEISDDVIKTFTQQYMPIEAFLEGANAYFKQLMEQEKAKSTKA